MSISRCLTIGLLLLAASVTRAEDAPAEDAARDLARFRQELGMSRVILMKEAVDEADLHDDQRQALGEMLKETEDKINDAVSAERTSPTSADERRTTIKQIHDDFTRQVNAKFGADPNLRTLLGAQMNCVGTLVRVIDSGQAMDVLKEFELTDEQKTKAEQILDTAKQKIEDTSTSDVPDEKKQSVCVETIQKLRKLLTDEQRDKWNVTVDGYARAHSQNPAGGVMLHLVPGKVVPAPQRANP
jgi:hypothetical protein